MFIVADCLDPLLTDPYIDIDEQRTSTDGQTGITVSYRYIHGGFTGKNALFSFYFPLASQYQGRFFQGTYPTISTEDAREGDIAFGISNGAYVVSTNNGGGVNAAEGGTGAYRVNAAAAKFSRQVAAALYGAQAPIRGYLYGASGGAYQTMGALDSTEGVWDGGVPMVPGTSNAIPSNQVSMLLGMRVLADKFPGIVDALEPGGSGDPYAGLDAEERVTLKEISTLGFPLRGWWQYAGLNGGSFWAVAGGIRTVDPTYVDDFWSLPGYEGGDPASSVHADRMRVRHHRHGRRRRHGDPCPPPDGRPVRCRPRHYVGCFGRHDAALRHRRGHRSRARTGCNTRGDGSARAGRRGPSRQLLAPRVCSTTHATRCPRPPTSTHGTSTATLPANRSTHSERASSDRCFPALRVGHRPAISRGR